LEKTEAGYKSGGQVSYISPQNTTRGSSEDGVWFVEDSVGGRVLR